MSLGTRLEEEEGSCSSAQANLSCDEDNAILLFFDGIKNIGVCVLSSQHRPPQLPRLTHAEEDALFLHFRHCHRRKSRPCYLAGWVKVVRCVCVCVCVCVYKSGGDRYKNRSCGHVVRDIQ